MRVGVAKNAANCRHAEHTYTHTNTHINIQPRYSRLPADSINGIIALLTLLSTVHNKHTHTHTYSSLNVGGVCLIYANLLIFATCKFPTGSKVSDEKFPRRAHGERFKTQGPWTVRFANGKRPQNTSEWVVRIQIFGCRLTINRNAHVSFGDWVIRPISAAH